MPQMAPLPWVFLLILTIMCLLMLSTIIFFSMKEETIKVQKMTKETFLIKW